MKTIGLIGGMSWESTQVYYQQLNQHINQQLGGLHSARMVLINVDFAPIEALMDGDLQEWQEGAPATTLSGATALYLITPLTKIWSKNLMG